MKEERTAEVTNSAGLHARPAAKFVRIANRFDAEVWVAKNDLEVNAKSIMGVLMLAAERGSLLTVRARGHDAIAAVETLAGFVNQGFDNGEPERAR